MFQALLSTLSAAAQALNSGDFCSMDLNAMNAAFNSGLNAQMQARFDSIMQANMNNPEIQRQYQVYLQQGGTLTFPGYCQRYAETGGFSQQGYQNAVNLQNDIYRQETQQRTAWFQHQQTVQQQTSDYRNAVQDRIAEQRGELLSGQSPYQNSSDGSTWQLPNTASPGDVYRDPASGNYFAMDVHGQYWMNNGQGWWQSMNRQQ